jgi:hypothetical protein
MHKHPFIKDRKHHEGEKKQISTYTTALKVEATGIFEPMSTGMFRF